MPIFNGPIATAIRERAAENHPVIAAAVRAGAAQVAADPLTGATQADVPAIVATVTAQVAPIVENAQNREPWYQSRVIVGLVFAMVTMVGRWLGLEISLSASDQNTIMQALPFIGLAISAIGRGVKNLPPIRWSRPWTLFGIGR